MKDAAYDLSGWFLRRALAGADVELVKDFTGSNRNTSGDER